MDRESPWGTPGLHLMEKARESTALQHQDSIVSDFKNSNNRLLKITQVN